MSASQATFHPWLQAPIEAGVLRLESAWRLDWEMLVLPSLPWSPGVLEISQRVALFHLSQQAMTAH